MVLITVFDAGNFIICGSSTQFSYVWDYRQLEKKRNVSKSTSEGDFSFPIASGTYFLETLPPSSTPTPTFQGACSSTHSVASFAFWSSPHLSYSLTPLPLTYPPHTFFSDVVVGCLELNLPRHQSQRKFKSSKYSHVPFFEVSFCVFFFLSLHKPEDCPQTAASVAMETTASEATKDPLDLPVPLAFQVRMREMRYLQSTCRPYQIRSQGWTSVIWDHLCMIQSLRMENPKESGVGNWVYWVHEVEVYKI